MPTLLNQRHEFFAQGRANGQSQYDAYINAGFGGNATAASQINGRPEVQARIQELMEERAETIQTATENSSDDNVAELGRDWVLRQLKQNIKNAQASGQISAANKAVELMMDMLNLLPKKGKADDVLDQPGASSARPAANPDSMKNALDKLDKLAKLGDLDDDRDRDGVHDRAYGDE